MMTLRYHWKVHTFFGSGDPVGLCLNWPPDVDFFNWSDFSVAGILENLLVRAWLAYLVVGFCRRFQRSKGLAAYYGLQHL